MSARKGRPSFLRPLTQIAPQTSDTTVAHLGTTSKGSIPSASAGSRPRSRSSTGKTADVVPSSTTGAVGPTASAPSSRASSRHSSFAPNVAGHRKPSIVAREPTSSRRGSIWSTFGEDAASDLTEEEKAEAARNAFYSSFKTIWESGIDKISGDWWISLITGWKTGDIIGGKSQHIPYHHDIESESSPLMSQACFRLMTLGCHVSNMLGPLFSSMIYMPGFMRWPLQLWPFLARSSRKGFTFILRASPSDVKTTEYGPSIETASTRHSTDCWNLRRISLCS